MFSEEVIGTCHLSEYVIRLQKENQLQAKIENSYNKFKKSFAAVDNLSNSPNIFLYRIVVIFFQNQQNLSLIWHLTRCTNKKKYRQIIVKSNKICENTK